MEYKDIQEKGKKMQKEPFKGTDHGGRTFTHDKQAFGLDGKLPDRKSRPQSVPNFVKHEGAFRPANPSKKGYNGTLSPFPEYKSDPIKIPVRKREDPTKKKETFRPNSTALIIRPTPSVSLNRTNLKSELSAISARIL